MRHFRGWCNIPYNPETASRYEELYQGQPPRASNHMLDTINVENMINELTRQMQGSAGDDGVPQNNLNNFFDEEFDIDLEFGQFEQIEVPDFSNGRKGRFIHDFAKVWIIIIFGIYLNEWVFRI